MFTGIITGVGRIAALHDLGSGSGFGKRLTIETPAGYLDDVQPGDSIALAGACMTATAIDQPRATFAVDVSAESLARTAGLDRTGPVNLEKALRAGDRLGGHIVSGHVDGVGVVEQFARQGESHLLMVRVAQALAPFLAYKGSVAIDGVSLTINRVDDTPTGACIHLNLIPHTVQHTTLHTLAPGARVNVEIDTIARYVHRMQNVANGVAA